MVDHLPKIHGPRKIPLTIWKNSIFLPPLRQRKSLAAEIFRHIQLHAVLAILQNTS